MKKIMNIFQKILHFFLIASIFLCLYAAIGKKLEGEAYIGDFSSETFNNDWLYITDSEQNVVTLPQVLEGKKGQTLLLEKTLPDSVSDGMRLCVRAAQEDLWVYVDGILRSSYTSDGFSRMSYALPGAYLLADLSAEDAGKTVQLKLIPKVNHNIRLNEVQLCYGNNFWFTPLKTNLPVVLAAILSISFGTIACIGYHFVRRRLNIGKSLFYLGETMIVAGLWIISESRIRQILFHIPSLSSIFSFVLVETIAGFALMYFDAVQDYHYHRIYSLCECLVAAQVVLNTFLHFSGIAEYYDTLMFSHLWMVVSGLAAVSALLLDIRSRRIRAYSITAFGMFLFLIGCGMEVVSFYFLHFYILGVFTILGLILLLGATCLQNIHDEILKFHQRRAELENINRKTIETVARTIDAKDAYTGGHSERVAHYAEMLARHVAARYHLTEQDIQHIHYIGLLHDIGKIGVPDAILNKSGKLTDAEFDQMKQHVSIGNQLVSSIDNMPDLSAGVLHHHERWDGRGYPDGLAGENIPLVARILCIADCYDAMTSDRVYRKRLPEEAVISEFRRCAGTQFDPVLAAAWLEILEKPDEFQTSGI